MSFEPLRLDRIIDLDGDTILEWAFQNNASVAMDLTGYTLAVTIHDGEEVLFALGVGTGVVVGSSTPYTDERGQSLGTATPVTATIAEAAKAALTDAQKLGPWILKFIYTPPAGATIVHDWGECTVLQTEIPA